MGRASDKMLFRTRMLRSVQAWIYEVFTAAFLVFGSLASPREGRVGGQQATVSENRTRGASFPLGPPTRPRGKWCPGQTQLNLSSPELTLTKQALG